MILTPQHSSQSERRRRNRKQKSCQPCRARKVRCDFRQPCNTCVQRNHPQLCSFARSSVTSEERGCTNTPHLADKTPSGSLRHAQSPTLYNCRVEGMRSPSTISSQNLFPVLEHISAKSVASCEFDPVTGQRTFIGRRAYASVFRTLLSYLPEHTVPTSNSLETIFGLTNRTTSQPFVSLWNATRVTVGEILRSLPSAENCLRYFQSYQQTEHPFFPIISDIRAFEHKLCKVLELLVSNTDDHSPYSTQLAAHLPLPELMEYALLFAVLASGCQICLVAEGYHELALSSRVFVACAFECLNLANFYVSPSPETIQTILIIAGVNCNDGNPGVAMSMLGMAAQQAQGMGMHVRQECLCGSSVCSCLGTNHPLWRAILILDSRLSMTYDRAPVISIADDTGSLQSLVRASHIEFWDCLFALNRLQLQWQSLGESSVHATTRLNATESILDHTTQLRQISLGTKSSLHDPQSVQMTLEKLVFTIHVNFFEGTLHLHMAIAKDGSHEMRLKHFHDMILKLCLVISTYLQLRQLSPIAKLAWEISRAFKSSAMLLAAFEVILHENFSGQLLDQLARVLAESSNLRTWRNDPVPSSCHAGLETLDSLLQARSITAIAVNSEEL